MNRSLKILFLGDAAENVIDRANALRRLGHEVLHLDVFKRRGQRIFGPIIFRLGPDYLESIFLGRLRRELSQADRFDLVFINQCPYLGAKSYRWLRQKHGPIITYANDDPYGQANERRWRGLIRALPEVSLAAVYREVNVEEARKLGAQHVIRVFSSYEDTRHKPPEYAPGERERLAAEVLFVGTALYGRDRFMASLLDAGVPLAIYGSGWRESPLWPKLASVYRGEALRGNDYVKVIGAAKIALGLLSKENRDLHTRRSMEIPAIGTFFCAERSSEHEALYSDGVEAVFWDNAEDCAQKCLYYLSHDAEREKIAIAGRNRLISNSHSNLSLMKILIQSAESFL